MISSNPLQMIRSLTELKQIRRELAPALRIGFVPTMGALHQGHLALVRRSLDECDLTFVSIFVNPLQFGPKEDFSQYPRPLDKDLELLRAEEADFVFTPETSEFYASDFSTFVSEESVSAPLCGALRPGHFKGVTTVVLKLFNLVRPDLAYFGQKDAQQCAVIERMVRDLNFPIQIVRCPTLREKDGLAISSRNIYLSVAERTKAHLIYDSLQVALQHFRQGERSTDKLLQVGRAVFEKEPLFKLQYWEIRDPVTMELVTGQIGSRGALIAVAAFLGKTRLIDNWDLKN